MAVKQWAVGDVLSAADMNAWTVPLAAVKPADTGRTNNTVSNDPDLQVAVASSASYSVFVNAPYKGTTNTNSDAQFTINAPAGSTGFFVCYRKIITGLTFSGDYAALGTNSNAGTNGTANIMTMFIHGTVTTGGTAGTLALGWGQNTTNGTPTTVLQNSILVAQRVG